MELANRICAILLLTVLGIPAWGVAQVEENADTSTEKVEDAFQEHFFEALKAKGIGNYDRAIGHLQECKTISPDAAVVHYELGLNYRLLSQPENALAALQTAVSFEEKNYWFMHALIEVMLEQNQSKEAIEKLEQHRQYGPEFGYLLSSVHLGGGSPEKALIVLEETEQKFGPSAASVALRLKLEAGQAEEVAVAKEQQEAAENEGSANNPVEEGVKELEALLQNGDGKGLDQRSAELLDIFPAQPEFYYYRGEALFLSGKPESSILVLEEGLAYLLDNEELELAFYKLMMKCYEKMGMPEKKKEIEDRIHKKGS